jgi:Glycosyltransferase family 92
MTGGAWSRFLDYAARARSKPAFDVEEREWKLEVAAELCSAVADNARAGDQIPRLLELLNRPRLPFLLATAQRRLLGEWGERDAASMRAALAPFADPALDPAQRIARFAVGVERVDRRDDEPHQSSVVAIGSVFNFAADPESLPIVRTGSFRRLAKIVGIEVDWGDGSAVALYEGALDFTRRIRAELEAAGVPIRDMIDVQSLIEICTNEASIWTADPPPDWLERAHRPLPEGAVYLAVCALFRNEARYLREWIEFHRLVGVERFFLYDDSSDDDYLEVLGPYVDEQVVVLHEWPTRSPDQRVVFDECLRDHREDARWIAFIDLDEFLFSPAGEKLDRLLPEHERWPGVGVEWAMCSVSGKDGEPSDLVIERYQFRDTYDQRLVKSIVDPLRTVRCENAHWFTFEYGLPVDENGWPLAIWGTKATSFERLRINHYASRSEEEARLKSTRQRSGWGHLRDWRARDLRGELDLVHDDAIARWVAPLRACLKRRKALR